MCRLKVIERGRFKLTFIIQHISEATFPLPTKQETKLVELGVLQLEYRKYSFQMNMKHKVTAQVVTACTMTVLHVWTN